MMRHLLVLAAALAGSAAAALAQSGTAQLYEQGAAHATPLYTMTQTEVREAGAVKSVRRVYRQPDGQDAVIEDATFENGRLRSLVQDHRQKQRLARLDVQGGKLSYTVTQDGETSTDSEDEPANLVTGFTMVDFLLAHWQQVLAGQPVEAQMPLMDRKMAVRVEWRKIGDAQVGGRAAVIVEARPANALLAMLANPSQVTLDRETGRMLNFSGRAVPMRKVDGAWKPLDADMVLIYDEPRAETAKAAERAPAKPKRARAKRPS